MLQQLIVGKITEHFETCAHVCTQASPAATTAYKLQMVAALCRPPLIMNFKFGAWLDDLV